MTPELSLLTVAGALLAFTVGLGAIVLRVPRCSACGRQGVGEARAITDADPSLVEVIYWCRACHTSLGRRALGHPGT